MSNSRAGIPKALMAVLPPLVFFTPGSATIFPPSESSILCMVEYSIRYPPKIKMDSLNDTYMSLVATQSVMMDTTVCREIVTQAQDTVETIGKSDCLGRGGPEIKIKAFAGSRSYEIFMGCDDPTAVLMKAKKNFKTRVLPIPDETRRKLQGILQSIAVRTRAAIDTSQVGPANGNPK